MSDKLSLVTGYGLLFPLVREATDFASGSGMPLLRGRARKVINTPAAGFGGRTGGGYPWRMNFGSFINMLRHTNMFGWEGDLAVVYSSEAIGAWEPALVVDTQLSGVHDHNELTGARVVRIYYKPTAETGDELREQSYQAPYHEVTL